MKDHAVIVIDRDGTLLFVQRAATKKTLPNIWAFPSGTVEPGESPEATVRREAKEELGVDVAVGRTFAVTEIAAFDVRLHFVLCRISSGEPAIRQPEEIQTLKWATFPEFFAEFGDDKIGHGLAWLRNHPGAWQAAFVEASRARAQP